MKVWKLFSTFVIRGWWWNCIFSYLWINCFFASVLTSCFKSRSVRTTNRHPSTRFYLDRSCHYLYQTCRFTDWVPNWKAKLRKVQISLFQMSLTCKKSKIVIDTRIIKLCFDHVLDILTYLVAMWFEIRKI